MADLKLVLGDPKTGKSYTKEVSQKPFLGKKIGETFKGELIDMTGYEFLITGGSDDSGFPMRKDIPKSGKARVLEVSGVGVNNKKKYRKKKKKGLRVMKGMRRRVTVAGNTVYEKTAQLNLKVLKMGKTPLDKPAAPAEGEAKAAPAEKGSSTEEAKAPAKKSAEKAEAPKEEKKAEKPADAPKEEAKAEEKPAEKPAEAKEAKAEKPAEAPAEKAE